MWSAIKLYMLLNLFIKCSEAANILFAIPVGIKSHHVVLSRIGLELASRGHNVTVITPFEEMNPPANYHQVVINITKKIFGNLFLTRKSDERRLTTNLMNGIFVTTKEIMKSSQFQDFLKQDNKFDVVINENFFQDAFIMLAYKYNAPLILATTFGNSMNLNMLTRNPLQLATVQFDLTPITKPTSFLGRLRNVYFTIFAYIVWNFWYLEKHNQLAKQYIPDLRDPVPSLYELQKNVSLILMNRHFSFEPPAAYLPNIVEVGGLHLSIQNTTLPEDLQKVLNDAKDGVVYMSLGTLLRSSLMSEEHKHIFLNVFKRLNQTVLWKWENDDVNIFSGSKNIITRNWFPQSAILAHPNVKVFISHGGLMGSQEAIYYGVPVIGIPVYGDQHNNARQLQEIGAGKVLSFDEINENLLEHAVSELLNDLSYKNKALELSTRFKDRPMTPLDTAMFWIEYVIRNKGANFAKNPARNLSWIAHNMIDVYVFILIAFLIVVYCLIKSICICCNMIRKCVRHIKKQKQH